MTFRLSSHQTVDVISSEPKCLVVEATYQPGGAQPPAHYHPAQEEHFVVAAGTVRAVVDGVTHDLGTGDTLTIKAGQVHRMWNPTSEPATVRWETTPAMDTEDWFRGLDQLQTTAEANGKPGTDPISFAAMASRHRDSFRFVVGGPKPLGDIVIQVLGAVGRVIGR